MYISRASSVIGFIISLIGGGRGEYLYRFVLVTMLLCFLGLRFPYIFGLQGFGLFLFFVVSPLFLGLFFSRVFGDVTQFFSSFVPDGTPL